MTDLILDAWLTVIGRDGWAAARIDAVAQAAGRPAGAVAAVLPDRWAALAAFGRHLDVAALGEAASDDASVRDRLFDMLIERFDAAQPYRAAASALAAALPRDPGLAVFAALSVPRSVARLADAAGVATAGPLGALRVQALTVLHAAVARVWLGDDSTDLAATMKALDTRLAQAEVWARRLPHRPGTTIMPPVFPTAAPRLTDGRPVG